MKILIVPDSYKGTLTSSEVCRAIREGILAVDPGSEISTLPFADGGEGFSQCVKTICCAQKLYCRCHNIYGNEIDGYIVAAGDTAVIDSATASGLLNRKQVMQASSYGTGELINFAISKGYRNILLGLGGTGCCDGGIGALVALGGRFFDENWNIIEKPKANDLNYIYGVDFKNVPKDIHITFACDVENTYFGKNGAAYVFAPQKGARQTDVAELDDGLRRINAFFKNDISNVKGAGAGGGICGGLYAVFSGEIKSGFDVLSGLSELESKIANSDLIITGEGKTDRQTLMGKLPYKISQLARKHGKRCVVISGSIEDVEIGDKMISLVDDNITVHEACENAREILTEKAKSILK